MVSGSRKRRRPDGRLASPPLAPSPLLTRNLQLLPVGLTQLPNDAQFVSRLRHDLDALLSAFDEAYILAILEVRKPSAETVASTSNVDTPTKEYVTSPFSVFCQVWQRQGWHYVQFAFGDHTDSKRAFGDAICQVLLEHLSPHLTERNNHPSHGLDASHQIRFADLKQLFKIMAVPFALYIFWSTQLYPDSGIGVKHSRPAMERIPIEQDYYDWLLDLPEATLKHLQEEERTRSTAAAITADLVDVVCRLAGQFDAAPSVANTEIAPTSGTSKSKQKQKDSHNPDTPKTAQNPDPVFDIIPHSSLGTRLPRTWPSMRVMSSLEANKEFGRIGSIVRVRPGSTDSTDPTADSRERVAGLSRGDVVRLKARQRLALASADLSKLLGTSDSGSKPNQQSDLLAQTAQRATQGVRYEIETPPWITSSKYTAKLKPWLDQEHATPMQVSMGRAEGSKKRYLEARSRIMPSAAGVGGIASASQDEGGPATHTDYGDWVLRNFRREREALRAQKGGASAGSSDGTASAGSGAGEIVEEGGEDTVAMDAERTLTLDELFGLAARRAKTAAVERGETLKKATGKGRNASRTD